MGDLGQRARFRVGDWSIEPGLGRIQRGDRSTELEPRVMDLLVYLAENAGETVSTDDLVSHVWAGRAVTDQPVYQGIAQLRKALEDDSRDPRYVVTVTKKGYRLIAPVDRETAVRKPASKRQRHLVSVLSFFLAGSYFLLSSSDVSQSRERPSITPTEAGSIAVLPFVDLSEDQSNQYLGDGIAEELIHRIAADSNIRVVARTSSFSFREQNANVQDIGRALGADIILEGSVRRAGDRVRVTAQLVNASDGYHIWSRSFDRYMTDTFSLQDHIAASVADVLQLDGGGTDVHRRSWTQSSDAANAYYLGMYHMHKRRPDSLEIALRYLQEAVQHDPQFALAYAGLSKAYFLASDERFGRLDDKDATQRSAAALRTAEALDPTLSEVIELLADEALVANDFVKSESLHLQAIEKNPSNATALKAYGMLLFIMGRLEEALTIRQEAVGLDPVSPIMRVNLGRSYLSLHRLDEAEREFRTAVELDPEWHVSYARLVEVLGISGRLAESIEISKRALSVEGPDARFADWLTLRIGYGYLLLGDFESSGQWFQRGEKLQVQNWFAANHRMHWLLAQDRYGEADSLLTYWTEQAPDLVNVFRLGGLYRAVMQQDDIAIAMFESALVMWANDDNESTLVTTDFLHWGYLPAVHLAQLYRRGGRTADADRLLADCDALMAEIDKRGFDSPGVHYVRASLHELAGNEKEALESMQKAVDDGWSKLWFVERDPIFAEYRGTSDFEVILDQLRSRLAVESRLVASMRIAE